MNVTQRPATGAIRDSGIKLLNGRSDSSRLIVDVYGYYDNGVPPKNGTQSQNLNRT